MTGDGHELPMFPLETVLFPGSALPLHVFEERYRAMVAKLLAGDGQFGIVLIERGREVGGGDVRVDVGTLTQTGAVAELPDGRYVLTTSGVKRLGVLEWLPDDPYPRARVEVFDDTDPVDPDQVAAVADSVRRTWALLSELGADSPPDTGDEVPVEGSQAVWHWCALAPLTVLDQYDVLAAPTHTARLGLLLSLTAAVAADARTMLGGERGP